MRNPKTESCETCIFWSRWFPKGPVGAVVEAVSRNLGVRVEAGRGDCVRHAPAAHGHYSTSGDHWCGDYEPAIPSDPHMEQDAT